MKEDLVRYLETVAELMELNEENPFKVRAFKKGAESIAAADALRLDRDHLADLLELPGVGKGIVATIQEWLESGSADGADTATLKTLRAQLPVGLEELTQVSGLGAKKARLLIESLGIQSAADLEYACRENRLVDLKGFGAKTQAKLLEGARFVIASHGKIRFDEFERWFVGHLELSAFADWGNFGRGLPVIESMTLPDTPITREVVGTNQVPVRIQWITETAEHSRAWSQWVSTASQEHQVSVLQRLGGHVSEAQQASTVKAIYEIAQLPFHSAECREWAVGADPARWVTEAQIRGVFHFHTTRSDGSASLDEMVQAGIDRGYEYMGVSDHSQTAFYARGLKAADLEEQWVDVQRARKKFPNIRLFWGIESDILADGALDYSEEWLRRFDFVVASIHSRFSMNRDEMTDRLLRVLDHPRTTILGHPSGRLLLGRPPIDAAWDRILAHAVKREVIVELNAHPARLDLDWTLIPQFTQAGGVISIGPDAHEPDGFDDLRHGVRMARKGAAAIKNVFNTWNASEVAAWFEKRKN